MDGPDLVTITEASQRLRTPPATLRYWRHLGTGPKSFKIGRRIVYRRDELEEWIEAQRRDAP